MKYFYKKITALIQNFFLKESGKRVTLFSLFLLLIFDLCLLFAVAFAVATGMSEVKYHIGYSQLQFPQSCLVLTEEFEQGSSKRKAEIVYENLFFAPLSTETFNYENWNWIESCNMASIGVTKLIQNKNLNDLLLNFYITNNEIEIYSNEIDTLKESFDSSMQENTMDRSRVYSGLTEKAIKIESSFENSYRKKEVLLKKLDRLLDKISRHPAIKEYELFVHNLNYAAEFGAMRFQNDRSQLLAHVMGYLIEFVLLFSILPIVFFLRKYKKINSLVSSHVFLVVGVLALLRSVSLLIGY